MTEDKKHQLDELMLSDIMNYLSARVFSIEEDLRMQNKKLTKAKELIKNIIRVTWGVGWNYSLDWKGKAEQFLNSEVEK